jgi:hypothetical protein
MSGEKERVDAYMGTVARMEPEITMVDHDAAMASIAISLKRIADVLEKAESRKSLVQMHPDGIVRPVYPQDGSEMP